MSNPEDELFALVRAKGGRIPSDSFTDQRPCAPTRHDRPHLRHDPDTDLHVCPRCWQQFRWNRIGRIFDRIVR